MKIFQDRQNKKSRGFTLIELMVVIVILGVLAALIVPKVMSRPDEARVVAARQDIATLSQALKLYRLDNKAYPTTEQGLAALTANSGLDERDDAVSKLGYCSEVLDKLQYEFPAHDWVKQTLREASERLMYLLNSDTFAQPDDAKAVAGIIGLLDKVLK